MNAVTPIITRTEKKIAIALTLLWMTVSMANAGEIYVDAAALPEEADGTAERPYATIQAAVDNAKAGDTIRVAFGVYTNGMTLVSGASYARVYIKGKENLKIIGAGRGKSIIAGSRDPAADTYDDVLTDERTHLVSGVYVEDSDGTVIEGFTIRDGEAFVNVETGFRKGGGVMSDSLKVYVVDCDICHCTARFGAGLYNVTALRCLIDGNAGLTSVGCRDSRLINCILTRNAVGSNYSVAHNSSLFNCTFYGNVGGNAAGNGCVVRNCAIVHLKDGKFSNEIKNVVDDPDDVQFSVLSSTAAKGSCQFLAPAAGDWRLLAGSDAVDAGSWAELAGLDLPEGMEADKDFLLNPVMPVDGKINAGAVQTVVAPAGGALVFADGNCSVDGYVTVGGWPTYAYPEFYPTQFCVRAVLEEGEELYRLERYDPSTGKISTGYLSTVPQLDGNMWLMPPLSVDIAVTNKMIKAGRVIWVDKATGCDTWGEDVDDAGSAAHPYATIQKAVDCITEGNAVVKVLPGDYDTGVTTNEAYGTFRLHVDGKKVRIASEAGAAVTTIRGAPDYATVDSEGLSAGLGTNAVKCVYLRGGNAYLQGFTLADGYTDNERSCDGFRRGSAVVSGAETTTSSDMSTLLDCVITNCRSSYQGIYYTRLMRTRIVDCVTVDQAALACGGMMWGCYARGCTITCGNTTGFINGGAKVWQSTFVGEVKSGKVCSTKNFSCNSIWDGGTYVGSACVFTNSIAYNVKNYNTDVGFSKVDPLFVSRETDGALRSDSPAVGMGDELVSYAFADEYWRVAGGDVNGDPLVFTDGKCTIGAFQKTYGVVEVSVPLPADGGWTLADNVQFGDILLVEGRPLKIVPSTGVRPCIGVSCGGKEHLFTNAPNETIILDYDMLTGTGAKPVITGIYSTCWYVDDDGDDANTGFLPTHPKKTLATAASALQDGDTLRVFPGVYDDGFALHADSATASRVVVKSGTAVVSLEGAEKTIIKGASASPEYATDAYGLGRDACRCAYVDSNSRLEGFTLTGGRVCTNEAVEVIRNGAAVFGAGCDRQSVVSSCIISNNIGYMGTAFKVDLFDCLIVENTTLSAGSGMRTANAYNCCFAKNQGTSVLSYVRDVWGTTVSSDNRDIGGGTAKLLVNFVENGKLFNSLIQGKLDLGGVTYGNHISNCVCAAGSSFGEALSTGRVYMVDFDSQVFVDGVVPVAPDNSAVDAADETLCTNLCSNTDLRGFQRVMNGRRDIGAYEADWRGVYASTLCPVNGALTVESASPDVVKEGDALKINSGTVAATWRNSTGKNVFCEIPVQVTGDGSLTVTLDDEVIGSVGASDGVTKLSFMDKVELHRLVFAYVPGDSGEGAAIVGRFTRSRQAGLVFSVR